VRRSAAAPVLCHLIIFGTLATNSFRLTVNQYDLAGMLHKATLDYTEALFRAAVFAFWRRTVGVGFLITWALLSCVLAFQVWLGDRSWFIGALGAILLLGFLLAFLIYVVPLRKGLARLRAMGVPTATFSLQDDSFTISSELGTTTLPWSAIAEVRRYPSFWLLLFSKTRFATIPLASVPAEAQAFILSRVAAAGGKIAG
jgi:hypothetical protein